MNTKTGVPVHPVQAHFRPGQGAQAPQLVTLRAYEVYCRLFGEQKAMVEGDLSRRLRRW